MAPRAIWTGTISFGLVSIPVRMYSAIQEHKVHFHYLHRKDDSPIGYAKYCKTEDKPFPDDEIGKAFEISKGKYVYVEDEDLEAAQVEGYHTMELTDFVNEEEIDPIYFEKTYYLGPQDGGEKVYALLAKAMADSGLSGLGKYVMRDREHLGCLRVRDGLLTLEKMFFADEIRPAKGIKPARATVSKQELEMAEQLIDRFTGKFRPEKYKDTYTDELKKAIKAKQRGKEVREAPEVEEEAETVDLMEALRQSMKASKRRAAGGRTKRSSSSRRRARKAA
jgi:DNA end-binding protein Ku